MNILNIDYDKGIVKSDYHEWQIISNNANKFMLLQREEKGRFHAAEADVKKMHLWEVKEINYRAPAGETFYFDEESGIMKI